MKAIWKGILSIQKLSIPIKMYTAVKQNTLGAHLLCDKDHTRLQYHRYCPTCKKNIDWEHVVHGIQLDDGSYYILTEGKLEKLKPEKTTHINIEKFVPFENISSIYYDAHYYIAPQKITEKGYFLIAQELKATHLCAIGTMIFHEKSYVCAIQSYEQGLLCSRLNYQEEIRPISNIEVLAVEIKAYATHTEKKLLKELMNNMLKKELNMKQYKDTFMADIKEAINRKTAGRKIISERAQKSISKKIPKENLEAMLRASLKLEIKKHKRSTRT